MSLSVQFFSLLAMIGTGIIAGAMIDLAGTMIETAKNGSILKRYALVLEVIVWIVAGAFAFFVLYMTRDGAWRIYDPLAQFSGLLLYVAFFHRPFRVLGRIFFVLFIKPVRFIMNIIYMLIMSIIRFILRVLQLLFRPLTFIYSKLFGKSFKIKRK